VTDRPGVTSTILGARTLEQLETNLAAADLHLSDDEIATFDTASAPGSGTIRTGRWASSSPAGRSPAADS
jgi:aryl-alcohol dehydrogenase-like predicted oxidoreductase